MPTLAADRHQSQCIQRQDVLDQAVSEVLADPEMFAEAMDELFELRYIDAVADAERNAALDAFMQIARRPVSHLDKAIAPHINRVIRRYAERLAEARYEGMGL